MIIVCQICKNEIAEADDLSYPLRGGMFRPHRTGFPPPFFDVEWEWIKCRYCKKRPFLERNQVLTTEGIVYLDETTDESLVCHKCGKQYVKNRYGLPWFRKHVEECDGNPTTE